jgi:DNA-binding MarR family transcriptional regulator
MTNSPPIVHTSIVTRMRSLLERLHSESSQIYETYGFSESPHWIGPLSLLDAADPDPVTATEMASALRIAPPTVAQAVQGLQAAGLIEARPHATDRRRRNLHLTALGRERIAALKPLWRAFQQTSRELDQETGGIIATLNRLSDSLDERNVRTRVSEALGMTEAGQRLLEQHKASDQGPDHE